MLVTEKLDCFGNKDSKMESVSYKYNVVRK